MNWFGNQGFAFPDPGTVKTLQCGVCSVPMTAERNVLGPTSFAGAMGGIKRRHDSFRCPHYLTQWHQKVVALLSEGRATQSERIRAILAGEISEILRRRRIR